MKYVQWINALINSGTFAELQANIAQVTSSSTLTLNNNYECENGFDSGGILIDKTMTIDAHEKSRN